VNWRLGVVGSPIAHSLSPDLHEAGLMMAGLRGSSSRVHLEASDAATLTTLMGGRFDALSVTMPLKEVAASYCDDLDEVAARTGVVNSLLYRDGVLHGANTDGPGFVAAVRGEFGVTLAQRRVVVLGAGGAARAIVDALVHEGVGEVLVRARNEQRARTLHERYGDVVSLSLDAGRGGVDLVVNTVPEAGRSNDEALVDGLVKDTIAVDITYAPVLSTWRAAYAAAGCRTQNGLVMLAYQAALQMSWWFDARLDGAELVKVIS
jgi:shikimate dehydrogenase